MFVYSRNSQPKHTVIRLLFRFIAGRPLDAIARTDSTFLRRATADHAPFGRPSSRWSHLPGWQRVLWRIGGTVLAAGLAAGAVIDWQALAACLALVLAAGLTFLTWRTIRGIRIRRHNKRLVIPLFRTLAPIIGHPAGDNPARYLSIPHNFRDIENPVIKIQIPPTWEGTVTDQKRVSGLIERRLGGDWETRFYTHAFPPYAETRPAPAPPGRVGFDEIKPALDAADRNTVVIGHGASKKIVSVNLDTDAPHIALSMGTGAGKSSLLRLFVAQLKRNGVERIDIIDPKRVSHDWAKNIPGVYIHRTMQAQMEALHNFRLRMESRYDAITTDAEMIFPRHVLLIEEQNSWMSYAQMFWDDYRAELEQSERSRVPRKNPAIGDLGFCLFQGRQACMNIVSVFQRMSAGAAGGGDLRENYGAKLLARYSPQTWKLLVGTSPVPRSSRISGRGMYVLGDEHHAVQFAYLREAKAKDWPGLPREQWKDEAYEYAMSGQTVTAGAGPDGPDSDSETPGPLAEVIDLVSLREAVTAGIVPRKLSAVRKARSRDPRFPAAVPDRSGTALLYRAADLRAYYAAPGQPQAA